MPEARGPMHVLADKEVSFTGRLASMSRAEAAALVGDFGGVFVPYPNRRTRYLVVGQEGWPLQKDGQLTGKLRKAQRLRSQDLPIEIVTEEQFLAQLGDSARRDEVHRHYTAAQLAAILNVRRTAIRRWLRLGLIRPVRIIFRLELFDFAQVSQAKSVYDLVQSGVAAERVSQSLRELRAAFPDIGALPAFAALEQGRQPLFRLDCGGLTNSRGQLQFDFSSGDGEPLSLPIARPPQTADEWFDAAFDDEEAGNLADALDKYRRAMLIGGPTPQRCFNLANVLHALGRKAEAAERFRQAVEMESDFVEAWNNLGNILAELGDYAESIAALRRCLSLAGDYADAHFNLAESLFKTGQIEEARIHWQAYLGYDVRSPWAAHVQRRLAETAFRSNSCR